MVARLNSICFFDFHSSPSGPFLMAQSRRRLVVSRLRGRAVRTSVLDSFESRALSFYATFGAGVFLRGVKLEARVDRRLRALRLA
jgi:hypothetical protein